MERKIVFNHGIITYKGLFSVPELYRMIDLWFLEKGYTKHELMMKEEIEEECKKIFTILEPYRYLSDGMRYQIRIDIECKEVKEIDVERDGMAVRLNQGECNIIITGYLRTDYEFKWEKNAWFYFIRSAIDKYVWRSHTYKGESGLVKECENLMAQIRGFLNLYRYQ